MCHWELFDLQACLGSKTGLSWQNVLTSSHVLFGGLSVYCTIALAEHLNPVLHRSPLDTPQWRPVRLYRDYTTCNHASVIFLSGTSLSFILAVVCISAWNECSPPRAGDVHCTCIFSAIRSFVRRTSFVFSRPHISIFPWNLIKYPSGFPGCH